MLQGLQRAAGLFALILLLGGTVPDKSMAIAVASSAKFIVYAPTQRLADKAVGHADAFAQQVSAEWGVASRPGSKSLAQQPPTTINIELDDSRSFARTLTGSGQGHLMWLVGSEAAVTEYLLQHEVAHTVMAAKFGDAMPIWANEGIASRYDNARRHAIRAAKLGEFVEMESWPHLNELFSKPVRQQWQYAAAVSVTEFLLQSGGRRRFMAFAQQAVDEGHQSALQQHYGFRSIEHLETEWRKFVRRERLATPRAVVAVRPLSAKAVASSHSFR